jgi:hypothetical protein
LRSHHEPIRDQRPVITVNCASDTLFRRIARSFPIFSSLSKNFTIQSPSTEVSETIVAEIDGAHYKI